MDTDLHCECMAGRHASGIRAEAGWTVEDKESGEGHGRE